MVAVVLLGVAAAGYFGWTKMQSAAGTASAASSGTRTNFSGYAASSPRDGGAGSSSVIARSSGTDADGTELGRVRTSIIFEAVGRVLAETPGSKTASPAAKPAGIDNPVTALKAPAAATPAPAEPLLVKNGESSRHNTEAVSQEPEQPPTATSISTGADTSAVAGLVNTNAINAQRAAQQTVRISQGVSQGLIIKRVQPVYPAQAMQMRLEGMVELQANISKTGNITGIKQLSGQCVAGTCGDGCRSAVEI